METKTIDKRTFKIHFIKTDKFKNVNIRISLRNKINNNEITKRNFLTSLLTYSTKKYKTKRELMIKSQELYGVNISDRNMRLGNYFLSVFNLNALEEKYTEKGNLEECVKLLSEVIFNPNVEMQKFDNDSFDIVKKMIEGEIKSFKENTDAYSLSRMYEEMDKDAPYAYRLVGSLEDLKKINSTNLYTYYKDFIRNSVVDIYVIGNFDFDTMEKVITDNFKFYKLNSEDNPYLPITKARNKVKKVIETDDLSQSKLAIGCKYSKLDEFDLKYSLTMYNILLGVSTDSKLFRIVREKNSLAYYVYSRASKLDNLLLVISGIEGKNFNKTVKLVEELMNDMKKGNFTEEDMNKASTFFIASLEQLEDSEYEILENYVAMQILGIDDIETRKKKIKEVKKEDIIRVAKKIKIDTIYLLKGARENEED